MSQYQIAFESSISSTAPINRLPVETLVEIFKAYVASYPERGAVCLCLVSKYWNAIVNDIPQLWTRINFSCPFGPGHIGAALKRVRASRLEKLDISIHFHDPTGTYEEPEHDGIESGWAQEVMNVLGGTVPRWKSIEVVSDTWIPVFRLMEIWTAYTHLPSLESISMMRDSQTSGMRDVTFDPETFIEPIALFGQQPSLPELRELSMSAVHVDWDAISAGFNNLRNLEITNQACDTGPAFEEFAKMLSSSPRLERLDVSGFCPEYMTEHNGIPVVHLPELKEFKFGWKAVDLGCRFLQIFQIGSSLESLTLVDTESGLGLWTDSQTGKRCWNQSSEEIFDFLRELGIAAPEGAGDLPPQPFISLRGVKSLGIVWTESEQGALIRFLQMLGGLEKIMLEDVDKNVLEAVVQIGRNRATANPSLREVDLLWEWPKKIPGFAEGCIQSLEEAGLKTSWELRKGEVGSEVSEDGQDSD